MRAMLIDWMSEVSSDHLFRRETFYSSVNYVDWYLSYKKNVPKEKLQLIGLTSLFLAAKIEEVYTPKIEHMKSAAKNKYS